ncbi:Long-chain base-1-phosphate phosphatase [Stygiomarasmius scandens]|uniref:Long-chain base-1-phosphate phosphatase n=1 Tax=Marasmiellus scandens TaxID=2682957 RepID=A0ABR1JK45_9AGAR
MTTYDPIPGLQNGFNDSDDLKDTHNAHNVHFTLDSEPSSAASSRSSSPIPSPTFNLSPGQAYLYHTQAGAYLKPKKELNPPGRQGRDVYDMTLPKWRAGLRRVLVRMVRKESVIIARMQEKIRTPFLDAYFVYTSSLGTHTFFMTLLPALFFFGYPDVGAALITVLASGVYFSSFIKDLLCSPRPFAPPVTRLTIGTHHLEYGFPSTHSTNSVSIALLFFGHVYTLATPSNSEPAVISPQTYVLLCGLLVWYTFSIVYGRLYTAMHSFVDCIMGVALGAGIWWVLTDFPGIPLSIPSPVASLLSAVMPYLPPSLASSIPTSTIHFLRGLGLNARLQSWTEHGGWEVPLILIPITLLGVNQHPQPVDDCPCFEDAIAFSSVVLGQLLSRWFMAYFDTNSLIPRGLVPMPGSGWVYDSLSKAYTAAPRTLDDILLWWTIAAAKMIVGILIIFTWRLLAKSLFHLILPPTFRFLSRMFSLPSRRFYTPATDYKSVPSEFNSEAGLGLRPIPSVIDLPGTGLGVGVEVGGIGSGIGVDGRSGSEMKSRGEKGKSNGMVEKESTGNGVGIEEKDNGKEDPAVKHYDADVLTKVFVYAGIAILACGVIPTMFELLGWGVKSWPS